MDCPASDIEITVVVTCFNEENFISSTLDNVSAALRESGRTHEIIVVNDASSDRSAEVVGAYIEKHPDANITLRNNPRNRGLANSYIDTAFVGRGRYYRLCCGDDAEPKEVLANLFRHISDADIVIPYQDQSQVEGKSMARRILSRIFTALVNSVSGYDIKYYNGLAIHLRYNVMRWHPNSCGFGFQADMLTRLLDEGATYVQIPSTSVDRKGGASTAVSMRNILSVGHTILELAIRRIRRAIYGKSMTKPVELKPKS
jgi:glycosyltransferase involved in cell wall biosynthesis